MSLKAGTLNRKVVIQRPANEQDEIGQPVQTWANLVATGQGKVAANIKQLNGYETIKGGAETSVAKVSIRIRYRADVTAQMRVVHGATTYQIKSIHPDEAGREYVDLACEVIA